MPSHIIEVDWHSVEGFLGPVQYPAPGQPWEDMAFKTIVCVAIDESSDQASVRRNSAMQLFLRPEQLARKTDEHGKLWLWTGSPAIHIFSVAFLKRVTQGPVRPW